MSLLRAPWMLGRWARRVTVLAVLMAIASAAPLRAQEAPLPVSIEGFPDTPEGAYKALLFGMGAGDEAAVRAIALPGPGLDRLLEINRVPVAMRARLRENLLKSGVVRRLRAGEVVNMENKDVYIVKETEVSGDKALVLDGARLPIRCVKTGGRWRVDARLVIANRKVAGLSTLDPKAPRRDLLMPSPLTGSPYPNTPEGAYRTFLLAYLTADAANLRAVALPVEGFDELLHVPSCSFTQAAKRRADLDGRTFRTLKAGETVDAGGGRSITISPSMVSPTRAVVTADLPAMVPTGCELVDGKWWVDPRSLIAGLKAQANAQATPKVDPATTPASATTTPRP